MVWSKQDRRSAQGAYLVQCSDVFEALQRLVQRENGAKAFSHRLLREQIWLVYVRWKGRVGV